MTAPATDEEVCCLFCKATPSEAALRAEGAILACVSEGECYDRAAEHTDAVLAAKAGAQ
jgi:hypothetical protein